MATRWVIPASPTYRTSTPSPSPSPSPSPAPAIAYRRLALRVRLALKRAELHRKWNSIQAFRDLHNLAKAELDGPQAVNDILAGLSSPPRAATKSRRRRAPSTPKRQTSPDAFFDAKEWPSPPSPARDAYFTPRQYPSPPPSPPSSLKRKIDSPEDVSMAETLYSPISLARKMRRVHFNNESAFLNTVAPSVRYINQGGLAGASTPSPFNRTSFKTMRGGRRVSSGSSNAADSSPVAPYIPSSPVNPPSPMPTDVTKDPISPCPAPTTERVIKKPSSRIARAAALQSRSSTPTTSTANISTINSAVRDMSTLRSTPARRNMHAGKMSAADVSTVNDTTTNTNVSSRHNKIARNISTRHTRADNTSSVNTATANTSSVNTPAVNNPNVNAPSTNTRATNTSTANTSTTNIAPTHTSAANIVMASSPAVNAAAACAPIIRENLAQRNISREVSRQDLEKLTSDYSRLFNPSKSRSSLEISRQEQTSEAIEQTNAAAQAAAAIARQVKEEKRLEEEKEKRLKEEENRLKEEEERLKEEEEKRHAHRARTVIHQLTSEWDAKVDKVLNMKNPQASIPNTNLVRHDFGTLIPKTSSEGIGWLNDEIITEFLNKVTSKGLENTKRTKRADEAPKYHAFSSHLYTKWATAQAKKPGQSPYPEVSRWVSRAKIDGKKLLQTEQIYIPINDRSHWTLIEISGIHKKIRYYDSLGGRGDVYKKFALEFVAGVLAGDFDPQQWDVQSGRSTRQKNGVDCGVFVCMNALALAKGLDPHLVVVADEMPAARREIAAVLLNGGFSGDLDF